ncbi:potassium channel family protein, partial [Streptomyces sp. NPDC005180]|uniref:potassium channel family protein n=1 Tax=Streptomyces sp. NPDC005180 TaxID=3156868 RepID=UPI0033A8553C
MAREADEQLAVSRVKLPKRVVERPLLQVGKRLLLALVVLLLTVFIVWLDRGGYHDNADGKVDFLDSFYYATVTLSTTGYGDIVPHSDSARLVNVLLVTPLRVLFLIILVGTTLEVLTERTRDEWRLNRWRSTLRDHTVVIGFGTKGRSALLTLCATGLKKEQVVIVDPSSKVIEAATADGFAGVIGDATRSDVLIRAELQRARQIIIATQRDDTAVLVALTARQLNRGAKIVAAVRLTGYDAAVLSEVVEHLDPPRLPALEYAVFGSARPRTVIVTTPNVEYNVRWETLPAGHVRHS